MQPYRWSPSKPGRSAVGGVIGLLLCGLTGCTSMMGDSLIEVRADYWLPELTGQVQFDGSGLTGTKIDLEDTLGVDDEVFPNFVAAVQAGPVTFEGSLFQVEHSGNTILQETINFNGEQFTVSDAIRSTSDLLLASGKVKFGLVHLGPFRAGVLIGAHYFAVKGSIESTLVKAKEELEGPIPIVGVVCGLEQEFGDHVTLFVNAEASGVAIDAFDVRGSFGEVLVRGGVSISLFRLGLGFRALAVDIEETDDENNSLDFDLVGPFVFGEFKF